jgi:hypothetical protein
MQHKSQFLFLISALTEINTPPANTVNMGKLFVTVFAGDLLGQPSKNRK